MIDDEIAAMALQLEVVARRDVPRFRIVQTGGDVDDYRIQANRAGYLCFAALLLRAAVASYRENSADILNLEVDKVTDLSSDIVFNHFERREDLWQDPKQPSQLTEKTNRWFLFGCVLMCLVFAIVFCMGLAAILRLVPL